MLALGAVTDSRIEFSGEELVTCTDCADYDLCVTCISLGDHGHHPGHRFQPVSSHISTINCRILSLCEVGRGVSHSAICDGCDKVSSEIFCLSCPRVLLMNEAADIWCPSQVLELSRLGLLYDVCCQRSSNSPWPSFCGPFRADC